MRKFVIRLIFKRWQCNSNALYRLRCPDARLLPMPYPPPPPSPFTECVELFQVSQLVYLHDRNNLHCHVAHLVYTRITSESLRSPYGLHRQPASLPPFLPSSLPPGITSLIALSLDMQFGHPNLRFGIYQSCLPPSG